MWTNQPSIKQAQARVTGFRPPYCANPACLWHEAGKIEDPDPFIRFGRRPIARFPYVSQRFRCRRCWRTFSASFFSLQFRDRKPDTYEQIHDLLMQGFSGCATARLMKLNEDTIRRRRQKMARWSLLTWARDTEKLRLRESVAYDGLENFSFSQYDINNLNHVVGRESFFVYDFNLSPMNRKGRLTPHQRARKAELEEIFGAYNGRDVEQASHRLFSRLCQRTPTAPLALYTDKHPAYSRAVARLPPGRIAHEQISSKLERNFHNRLFAINHVDMLTRHQLGTFRRETISFAKNTIAMLESFVLLATHKNYLRPRFWKAHAIDPQANKQSPAMKLGLRTRIQSFAEFFRTRITVHQVKLNDDWQNLFDRVDDSSRRVIRRYAGI